MIWLICIVFCVFCVPTAGALNIYDRQSLISIGLQFGLQSTHRLDCSLDRLAGEQWPAEILRNNNNNTRRRRRRGKRAGIRNKLRSRAHRPPLPSILLANVQSIENKLDDIRARIKFQRDIRDCNVFCLTETWLTPEVPDHAIRPADNFSVHRKDRTDDSGKSRGGGVAFMVNNYWCDPDNVKELSNHCSADLEYISIKCRPFFLPREFTSVILIGVYIPPQANKGLALSELHDEVNKLQTANVDAAIVVAGDFNRANLKKVLPNFYQHVTCPTRGENTLDHCYSQFKDGYRSQALSPFGKSDHDAIFLLPKY